MGSHPERYVVIHVFDDAGAVMETYEHVDEFREP
jgi:hypothetical protein